MFQFSSSRRYTGCYWGILKRVGKDLMYREGVLLEGSSSDTIKELIIFRSFDLKILKSRSQILIIISIFFRLECINHLNNFISSWNILDMILSTWSWSRRLNIMAYDPTVFMF